MLFLVLFLVVNDVMSVCKCSSLYILSYIHKCSQLNENVHIVRVLPRAVLEYHI